ncbi:MAG: hypothetical protein VX772_00300 [Bacteroidota bacterium]|nr:hypothetical protein [Bacteroidota bacterium]
MANLKSLNIDGDLPLKKGTTTHPNGTTVAVDLATGNYFEVDFQNVSGTITTFTITEALSGTQVQTFVLKITQGSPNWGIDWRGLPAFYWAPAGALAGSTPLLSASNDAVDILQFTTYDLGTTWYGEIVGLNFT